jgi:hypothetical protein
MSQTYTIRVYGLPREQGFIHDQFVYGIVAPPSNCYRCKLMDILIRKLAIMDLQAIFHH